MSKPTTIDTLAQFEATLNSAQRSYFQNREAQLGHQFQALLRHAAQVTTLASGLVGQVTIERSARESALSP